MQDHAALFGPEIWSLQLGARLGIVRDLDVSVDATGYQITNVGDGHNPYVGAGRVGAGYNPGTEHVALALGAGGGHSEAGGFASPDLAVIVGYENPYYVPYLRAWTAVSFPVASKAVEVESEQWQTPHPTVLYGGILGGRIPLGRTPLAPSLSTLLGLVTVRDEFERIRFVEVGVGFEIPFER